ncbi:putative LPS assembly protein LptD [Bizionia myxarmorum]|uniref:LPS-assembly protein LptD n=1 Tax=Bizionia myxarmorum TaxID=291186 RepID=A0A5D0R3Y1_9FLAO|nr:putative LPS assembly protein LptD [Bizionia myxarmorum]TYB76182.1 LPS-assembly protein LptD [Bizionia myxarmorum]
MTIQKPSHTFTKIHLKALRTNNFHILFALSFTVFINTFGFSQDLPKSGITVEASKDNDSLNVRVGNAIKPVTNEKGQDSIVKDTVKPKPGMLTGPVKYKATDYTSFNNKEQKLYMYNEAEVYYEDMELKAGIIIIDYNTNTVFAKGITDSTGVYTQAPIFKQLDNEVKPDSIKFNTKTQKALIYNSNTEQGDIKIFAPVTKKVNDSVIFLQKGRFTTAKDIDNPEYYFQANKIKIVPGEKIVVGLTNMVIADVPTPLGLPFGFFPLTNKQTSGVIIPTFGEESNRGYFIQNGGYYFALSEYFDLAVLGDYYTNGSYGLRMESSYANKYRFRGNLGFRYENLINSERGFPDYGKSNIYNIRWSHTQDTKANPSSRFAASVNLGSSNYYQTSINQVNAPSFLNNTLASSVSYSKTFQGDPQVNFSAAATHSQNTNTQVINMTLPTVQASVSRIFPFAPREGVKKGIIQNVNFQYNVRAENKILTTDSLFFKKEMWDNAENGIKHSIPLTTNFKILKYLSLSASTSYDETWVFETVKKYFDPDEEKVITQSIKGFDAFRTYNFSTSLGTTVYGMFDFRKDGKDRKIQQIRHVMRPSISYNINPSFSKYYQTFEVISADGLTTTEEEYTRFENGIFGVPNNRYSSSIGMSLSNNIEAKVRDKDSSATEARKIKLLDNLNFSTAYNVAGDSLNWSPLRMSGSTQILKNKMSINFGATMDPYALDNNNNKIDKFNTDNGGSLFRLTSANITMSYSISSRDFDGSDNDRSQEENLRSGGRDDDLFGRAQDFSDQSYYDKEDDEKQKEPSKLYTQKIPWDIKFAYAANYGNARRENEISSHSLMFSGDVEIAPQWTIGASSGYDFKNQGFTYTQLRFERDLLSWRMNLSWVPFSSRSSWYFFIGIKSNILKDIKYDKRRQPDQRL